MSLIAWYTDLKKVAQLLAVLSLGVPDVGPFLKAVTSIIFCKCILFFGLMMLTHQHH